MSTYEYGLAPATRRQQQLRCPSVVMRLRFKLVHWHVACPHPQAHVRTRHPTTPILTQEDRHCTQTQPTACSGRFAFLFAINMNAPQTPNSTAPKTTTMKPKTADGTCLPSSVAEFATVLTVSFCVVCAFVVYLTSHVASGLSSFTPIYTLLEADVVNWVLSSLVLAVSRAILRLYC